MDFPFSGQYRMTAILFVFIFLLWWSVSSPANKISTLRTQKNTMTTEDGVNINAYCSVRCCSPPNTSCVLAKSLQLCPTLCDPMDYSPPGSSVHGILQARILEWVAMPSPWDLPSSGNKPTFLMFPVLARGFFTTHSMSLCPFTPKTDYSPYPKG